MKKKFLVMMSILLLMAMAGSAMAAEGTYIDLSARDVVLSRVSENLGCRFENAKYYCLIKPDGTKLTNEIYTSISAVSSYPFFKVEADSKDGVHDEGLIDDQGNVIVPVMYADVSVVSDRWAYGVKLTPSSGDDKDYTFTNFSTGDKTFYRIDTVDFYYRGKQAGTLSRSDFDGYPTAYGDYICIQNREKKRVYYNSAMEKSPVDGDYGEYTSTYKNRATHYVHNGTGMPAFETGCTLTPAEVEKSIVYENGKFLNLQGEEAFKAAQNYDSFSGFHGDYAVVTMNRMKGLIDAAGQEVIPLEYEEIGNYEDQYLTFGVISAEKDGKFGFLDAAGNVTCPFTYSKDIVSNRGILASIKNLDGTIIVLSGLAGELPEHFNAGLHGSCEDTSGTGVPPADIGHTIGTPLPPAGSPASEEIRSDQDLDERIRKSILLLLGRGNALGHGLGRTVILSQLKSMGFVISDGQLRAILSRLADEGLLLIGKGRQGTKITNLGIRKQKEPH